jgi:hypothetical protein
LKFNAVEMRGVREMSGVEEGNGVKEIERREEKGRDREWKKKGREGR